jgi:hypothetical protein
VVLTGREEIRLSADTTTSPETAEYVLEGGFPTRETVQRAHYDADLNRAIHAY